jgi:hypothetical protein
LCFHARCQWQYPCQSMFRTSSCGHCHCPQCMEKARLCMTASPERQSVSPASFFSDRVALLPRVITIDILCTSVYRLGVAVAWCPLSCFYYVVRSRVFLLSIIPRTCLE